MSTKQRDYSPDCFYHIVQNGGDNSNIFYCDEDKQQFISILKSTHNDLFKPIVFCLMDTHFHLLVYAYDTKSISVYMGVVKVRYSKYTHSKYGKIVSAFSKRSYYKKPVIGAQQLLNTFKYILKNPIDALLCSNFDYQWSSYRYYFSDNQNSLYTKPIEKMFGTKQKMDNYLIKYTTQYVSFFREIQYRVLSEEQRKILRERNRNNTNSSASIDGNTSKTKISLKIEQMIQKLYNVHDPIRLPVGERVRLAKVIHKEMPYISISHIARALNLNRSTIYLHIKKVEK